MIELELIKLRSNNNSIIVQYSEKHIGHKNLYITVPHGYQAIILVDEKTAFRTTECVNKRLFDLNKSILKKTVQAAFVNTAKIKGLLWGFGGIKINGERPFIVGANGRYDLQICDAVKLFNNCTDKCTTTDSMRAQTISIIKSIGSEALYDYITKNAITSSEASLSSLSFQKVFIKKLTDNVSFEKNGLAVSALTVDEVYVDEDTPQCSAKTASNESSKVMETTDAEMFKSQMLEEVSRLFDEKINSVIESGAFTFGESETANDDSNNPSFYLKEMKDYIAEQLKTQRAEIEKKISKLSLQQSTSNTNERDIQRMRDEIMHEIETHFEEQTKILNSYIDESISEKITNSLPLQPQAEEEYLSKLKCSARVLLKMAKSLNDYIPIAAMIYSNVETNLVKKAKLRFKNKTFLIEKNDYKTIAGALHSGNYYPLKKRSMSNQTVIAMPKVQLTEGNKEYVEMPPVVRFYKASMSNEDAIDASERWLVINKIRHQADDNGKWISDFFASQSRNNNLGMNQYFLDTLDLFEKYGLYDADTNGGSK